MVKAMSTQQNQHFHFVAVAFRITNHFVMALIKGSLNPRFEFLQKIRIQERAAFTDVSRSFLYPLAECL